MCSKNILIIWIKTMNQIKQIKNLIKTIIREVLNEDNPKIIDYYNSKNKILVGKNTNLLRVMKERYEYASRVFGNTDEIYFFDKRYHFATLFKEGSVLELKHDGSLNDLGWRKS